MGSLQVVKLPKSIVVNEIIEDDDHAKYYPQVRQAVEKMSVKEKRKMKYDDAKIDVKKIDW